MFTQKNVFTNPLFAATGLTQFGWTLSVVTWSLRSRPIMRTTFPKTWVTSQTCGTALRALTSVTTSLVLYHSLFNSTTWWTAHPCTLLIGYIWSRASSETWGWPVLKSSHSGVWQHCQTRSDHEGRAHQGEKHTCWKSQGYTVRC